MKKNKSEIILSVIIVLFVILGLFTYRQSKQIISEKKIPYTEHGTVNYKVFLNNEKYYNKKYLDEGMQYIASIVDYLDVDFNYNGNYENIKKYDINKRITAKLSILDLDDDNKVIYTKSEVLKNNNEKKDNLNITDNVKINYQKYNSLANEFKTNYGISARSLLTVYYDLTYTNKENNLNQSKRLTLQIPLSSQMINITKGSDIDENSIYVGESASSPINRMLFIASMIFFGVAGIILLILIIEVIFRIKRESKYDRFIAKTLKDYDSYITEVKKESILDKPIINVKSFKELLDVRNNTEKTITYIKVSKNESKFQLIDDEIYEYRVTREEMDY